ncbi:MAG TPA: ankyrin repeat domain-containing protein [Anaerovoracaceae bacterium]|nr:ankyrin repeat domain-containing protein [Anaerovoracaceae bacterium]
MRDPIEDDFINAIMDGEIEEIKSLLEAHPDKLSIHDPLAVWTLGEHYKGSYPINIAASFNQAEVVKYLLEEGVMVDTVEVGETTLHLSTYAGSVEVATLLIEQGANLEAKDMDGNTPLCKAVEAGCIGTTKLLIDSGANTEVKLTINSHSYTIEEYANQCAENLGTDEANELAQLITTHKVELEKAKLDSVIANKEDKTTKRQKI